MSHEQTCGKKLSKNKQLSYTHDQIFTKSHRYESNKREEYWQQRTRK